jgi:LL-diaminopimelate aminotransferase
MKLNLNYLNVEDSYLFSTIAKKVNAYKAENPLTPVVSLGIGDVTLPMLPTVTTAMHSAVEEMSHAETFHGYGPEQGYTFLIDAIKKYYKSKSVILDDDEIFVSDGAKSDLANIMDIFDKSNKVLMPDPVYPAYRDVNLMLGRKISFVYGNKSNDFKPKPPKRGAFDIIYICSPNNPTGSVYTKAELEEWVAYARANGSIILFDAAYEHYVQDKSLPTSIYQIEGAKECAVEICSFSKTAGFTGTRCGYTVVPKTLYGGRPNKFWNRRQTTKFNGVAYVVQKGAEAVFSEQGTYELNNNIKYYMENGRIMHEALKKAGIWHTGGENSPYIWLACPKGVSSWQYFDYLLNEVQVVGTPGVGFGKKGEGYFRLTGFNSREKTEEAIKKLVSATEKLKAKK